jgi:hypothetical protein
MKRLMILVVLVACVGALAMAQSRPTAPSIEGVWKVAEVVTTGANAATNSKPEPSVVIFTRGYYSYISVNSSGPRPKFTPAKDPAKLTDADKIARYDQWNPFAANAGTYELKGTTLTRKPTVAKNVTVMTSDPPIVQELKLEDNTLWLTQKSAQGQPASETRTKLTRVR